ncbi:porin family protein [Flavobacterium chungbukense]|uniref:Porin family protein n=1 Tax=Flavobacterium chungbukense TaxID=877464 RepID=A0ABP7Y9J7_9FLAO|nr:porin family protein [Flavobacterium chungbukense]MCC4922446.1 PorT family protein [Flavobacterium chungbukense]
MKKILLLAVFTVLGFMNVNAQEIKFGAKAGLNFSTVNGSNTNNIDYVTSYHVGVVSEIPISEKFSFQPELMYSRQGYSFNNDVVAMNYLNIPLMGKYYVTKGLSVEAGPQIGFLLSAKNEGVKVTNSFTTFDFGANFGLGYKLENGLNFSARYNLGITKVDTDNRNGVFQVSVGYFFF